MRVSVIKRKINVVDLFLFFLEIMNLLIENEIIIIKIICIFGYIYALFFKF
jgi:hypothetical protein